MASRGSVPLGHGGSILLACGQAFLGPATSLCAQGFPGSMGPSGLQLVPHRFQPHWSGTGRVHVPVCAAGMPLARVVVFGVGRNACVITGPFLRDRLRLWGLRQAAEGRLLEVRAKDWMTMSADATSFLEASSSFLFSYRVGIAGENLSMTG
jgi:hypothetical protein